MKQQGALIRGITAAFGMLVIILDTRTAFISASDGVALCIRTIIPSLFPFFVLSGILNEYLLGRGLRVLQPLGRLCKIPKGAESLLLLGLLAGYPVGARLITQAYQTGALSERTAKRMLGFCNNAGPAFLFGMLTPLFTDIKAIWVLWAVHILSALVTGFILPKEEAEISQIQHSDTFSISESLQKAVHAIAGVCGWVILFRIVLGFCNRWFLWLLPPELQVLISGFLELANGCILLQNIPCEGMRFLLGGTMLSFGGLCVGMQTISVTTGLGTGQYFPGKVMQTALSVLLGLVLQPILFSKADAIKFAPSAIVGLSIFLATFLFTLRRKKVVAFSRNMLYNAGN